MKFVLKAAVVAVAFAASAAMAQAPGMMGGYGGGSGMMGGGYGQGMGGGMMGGGYGGGMMGGYGPLSGLKLSGEQEDKIFAIQEQQHAKNFATMTKMRAEAYKLRKLAGAENVDSKAVLEQQKKVDDVRREMLAAHLEMRKQVEAVLTPEQRKQMRDYGPWWMRNE